MYRMDQAKLYYLYMMIDGEVSKNEKKLFTTICNELNVDSDEKKHIINECKNVSENEILGRIRELAGEPVANSATSSALSSLFSMFGNSDDNPKILWNLINLGYADTKYTMEEREIVDFLREHWKISDDLYQEMIDISETCLALEKHKTWAESLDDASLREEKLKQIKKDIKFAQDSIKTTLAELDF